MRGDSPKKVFIIEVGKISKEEQDQLIKEMKKKMTIPPRPKFPPCRLIREGDAGRMCPKCDSSLKYKFWPFIKSDRCIQPQCDNYYGLDWISFIMKRR